MQASEIRFLQKIKGVTVLDKHRSTAIREPLDIESLLLRIEKSQLRWFGHASGTALPSHGKRSYLHF